MRHIIWIENCSCLLFLVLFCPLIFLTSGANTPHDLYWPTGGNAKCVNFTEVPTLYPGVVIPDACIDYVIWDKVYVDNNTLARNSLGRVAMGGSWSAPDCIIANWRNWCTEMFRPCEEVVVPYGSEANTTVAIGVYPCYEYCTGSHSACYGAIVASVQSISGWTQALVDAAVSCDPPWSVLYGTPYQGTPLYPNGTYTFNITKGTATFDVTLQCYRGNINITTTPPATVCPDGLYYSDGLCYFNCPEPLITDSEYDAITIMVSVMGWISLLSAAFLALTFLMDPDKRKFPANLSVFFILCIMCLSFSFCLGSMAGWRNVWCDDNNRPNTFGGPACTIQGIIFVYFSLASVLWWLVLSFNLLLMVTRVLPADIKFYWPDYLKGLKEPKGWLRWETLWIGYHIFAWIPPLIPLIISLAAQRLGYGGHDIWCTIHSGDQVSFYTDSTGQISYSGGDPANIWNLILLTVPILLCVAIGICILIFVVIWSIWKIGWRFFIQQWRLFLFIIFFIWIYSFVFSFQIHLAVQANSQYEEYTSYINCAFQLTALEATAPVTPVSFTCSNPSINGKVSFPLWFIVCFNEASQGFLLVLLYGTSWRFFKTWYLLFTRPRALLSSKFHSSMEGETKSKKAFSVIGRKLGASEMGSMGATGSKHMMDELEEDDETTTTTASSDVASSDEEVDGEEASKTESEPESVTAAVTKPN